MKRALLMAVVLLALLPGIAKAQWTFDIVSVEAYINDHKKQRSLLLAAVRWNTATSCCTSTAAKRSASTRN